MRIILAIALVCLLGRSNNAYGQEDVDVSPDVTELAVDSIVEHALNSGKVGYDTTQYRKRKHRLFNLLINTDTHISRYFDSPSSIWGLRLGVTIAGRYRMGFSGYMLPKRIDLPTLQSTTGIDSIYRRFDLVYFSTFMEFVPLNNFRWELSIPFSVGYGFGNILHKPKSETDYKVRHRRQGVFLHSGVAAHYKVFSWVGIGAGLGYRQVITPDSVVNAGLSNLFLTLRFKLFLGDLYLLLFKPDVIKGEKLAWKDHRRRKKELKRAEHRARRLK